LSAQGAWLECPLVGAERRQKTAYKPPDNPHEQPQAQSLKRSPAHSNRQYLADLDQAEREARKEKIKELFLQCFTAEEIGKAVGLNGGEMYKQVSSVSEHVLKQSKVTFSEESWKALARNGMASICLNHYPQTGTTVPICR
jgi:hypothetical protein